MYAELGAYRCQVFLDFSVVRDDDTGRWSALAADLGGRGVPSIDAAFRERELRPVRDAFRALLRAPAAKAYSAFLEAVVPLSGGRIDPDAALSMFARLSAAAEKDAFLRAWAILRPLAGPAPAGSPVPAWMEEWMLADLLADVLADTGFDRQTPVAALFAVLLSIPEKPRAITWDKVLKGPAVEKLLGVHSFEETKWFRKESLEMLAASVVLLRRVKTDKLLDAAKAAEYRWNDFLKRLETPAR